MTALLSVWMGLATIGVAGIMLLWRGAFTDGLVWLVLWLGAPGTMCLAGMTLWAHRKLDASEPGVGPQRLQCKVAIVLALGAAAIVYALVIGAQPIAAGTYES